MADILIAVQFDHEKQIEGGQFTNPTFHRVPEEMIDNYINFLTKATNKRVRVTKPTSCDRDEVLRCNGAYYNP